MVLRLLTYFGERSSYIRFHCICSLVSQRLNHVSNQAICSEYVLQDSLLENTQQCSAASTTRMQILPLLRKWPLGNYYLFSSAEFWYFVMAFSCLARLQLRSASDMHLFLTSSSVDCIQTHPRSDRALTISLNQSSWLDSNNCYSPVERPRHC